MTQTYDRNTAFIRIYTIKLASSLLDSLSLLLGLVSHVGQGLDVQSMPVRSTTPAYKLGEVTPTSIVAQLH